MARAFVFNWKTTLAGLASIAVGGYHLYHGDSSGTAYLTSGLGLMFASDAN